MKQEHPYKVFSLVPDIPSTVKFPINIEEMEEANDRYLKQVSERNVKQTPKEIYNLCKESL